MTAKRFNLNLPSLVDSLESTYKLRVKPVIDSITKVLIHPHYCHVDPEQFELTPDGVLPGATTFGISGGTIYYEDSMLALNPFVTINISTIPFTATDVTFYVYLKAAGTLEYRLTAPSANDPPDEVCLGVLISIDGGTSFFDIRPFVVDKSDIDQALLLTIDGIRIYEGYAFFVNPGTLTFGLGSGLAVGVGRNHFNDFRKRHLVSQPGIATLPIRFFDAAGNPSAPLTDFPFDTANLAGGSTLDVESSNDALVWPIYFSAGSTTAVSKYPTTEFGTLAVAREEWNLADLDLPAGIEGLTLAYVVIARRDTNAGNIDNPNRVIIVKVSGVGTGVGNIGSAGLPGKNLLADYTLPADSNTITIDSTIADDLEEYKQFELVATGKGTVATLSNVFLYVNGDTSDGNYRCNVTHIQLTSFSNAASSSPRVGFLSNINRKYEINAQIDILDDQYSYTQNGFFGNNDGAIRTGRFESSGQRVSNGPATELTSLTLFVDNSCDFAAGYRVKLYGIR